MKSITIHNLDDELDALIREKSKKEGKSLNKTIQSLLKQSLGLQKEKNDYRNEYIEFFGIWTEEDEKEFMKNTAELNQVNSGDWE
jgi:predicted HicB family RNase H-like nuclease